MEKSKKDDFSEKIKNKKNLNNISSKKTNEYQDNKKENNLENVQKESEEKINKEEKLLNEVTELKEEKLRLLAEMENLRKRFEREKIELIKFSSINLVREILSPGDNLERALAAIPKNEKLPHNDVQII